MSFCLERCVSSHGDLGEVRERPANMSTLAPQRNNTPLLSLQGEQRLIWRPKEAGERWNEIERVRERGLDRGREGKRQGGRDG